MWISLLIAGVLLIGMLAGLYLLQRYLKGEHLGLPFFSREPKQDSSAPDDLERFIAAYRRDKAQASAPAAVAAVATAPAAVVAAAPARATIATATIKPKTSFLGGPNKLLFLVLRTALPDYQIFPNVRLADAVQIAGQPPTPQARAQLAQARVDFVICNKELAVIALLDITDGNRADDVLKRQLEPQLLAAGGRYLRIAPNSIPKPAAVRALVFGA
jgi:hypothetical protein